MKKEITYKSFIKSNKQRREQLAKKAGKTVEDYAKVLQLIASGKRVEQAKETLEICIKEEVIKKQSLPTIHNVIILDGSGSMDGRKFDNSVKGIKTELDYMNKDNSINWTSTVHKFSSYSTYACEPHFMEKTFNSDIYLGYADGGTPLYSTIIKVVEKISNKVSLGDKVLIKIYTDGEDTEYDKYLKQCQDLLKSLDKNVYTFTFVGTQMDVERIIRNLGIDKSNTLVISNDGKGFEKAFETSLLATTSYVEKVVKNEDVSTGFYLKFD